MPRLLILSFLFLLVCYLVWKTLLVPLYKWVREDQKERKQELREVEDDSCCHSECQCAPAKKAKPKKAKPKKAKPKVSKPKGRPKKVK